MTAAKSQDQIQHEDWIQSLPDDELRAAQKLNVHKFDQPSFFGRTIEDFQEDQITATPADPDDDDWSLRVDLLAAGADPDRLDDICEAIEIHGETIGFRHARRAIHAITLPLMMSTDAKVHALIHALKMTTMTLEESAETCGCTKQAVHCHVTKWRGLLDG
jgi:hypothetical protein